MSIDLGPVIPVLRIFSEEKAREFYLDFLSFKVDWEHRFGTRFSHPTCRYPRGTFLLHLTEHHGGPSPGGIFLSKRAGSTPCIRELTEKAYRYMRPGIENAPWGARILTVIDPFANRIVFNEANPA